ncbi:phage major capsid protein [Candidatus Pacearchaeota archaeon]|nr:phage major capsid protein [Candidatus Pacearchaeota archaeon]
MATQTLAEAAKYINDEIVAGVAEDIIDLNPWFSILPYMGFTGQSINVNRETTIGDSGVYDVGDTITDKAASAVTKISFLATKLIGDAEMDNLVQIQSEGDGVDQLAIEISSKAKSIARLFQTGIATGTGVAPQINSFHSLVDASQYTTASAGQALSFALLDELLDLVTAKDGQVDFIMMPARTMRSFKVLLRGLGGTAADWVVTLPDGRTTIGYEGIPIFKNEYLSVTETANGAALTTGALTSVYAGCFDDGSRKLGVAAIHPIKVPAGIMVEEIGQKEAKDEGIWRVKQYVNFAIFNRRGVARLTSINN